MMQALDGYTNLLRFHLNVLPPSPFTVILELPKFNYKYLYAVNTNLLIFNKLPYYCFIYRHIIIIQYYMPMVQS